MSEFFHHSEDRENLDRILGEGRVGDVVLAELETWTKMMHRAGHPGPIGPVALVSLCRFLGLVPPETAKPAVVQDWESVPKGARVEAKFAGSWHPGVYRGPISMGSLGVTLDGDDRILETSQFYVRLEGGESPKAPEDFATVATFVTTSNEPFVAAETEVPPPIPEPVPVGKETTDIGGEWEAAQPGAAVWLQADDDELDAKFIRVTDGGLLVQVEGESEPREVARDAAMLV